MERPIGSDEFTGRLVDRIACGKAVELFDQPAICVITLDTVVAPI